MGEKIVPVSAQATFLRTEDPESSMPVHTCSPVQQLPGTITQILVESYVTSGLFTGSCRRAGSASRARLGGSQKKIRFTRSVPLLTKTQPSTLMRKSQHLFICAMDAAPFLLLLAWSNLVGFPTVSGAIEVQILVPALRIEGSSLERDEAIRIPFFC